jgi:O-acetyl-ADP-ribose deacetylase (regulator of RNase III)
MTETTIPANITFHHGDLFSSGADALVNPVNCVGVMGAGLAKQFKQRYPPMFAAYQAQCAARFYQPGDCRLWQQDGAPTIVNLATKNHWRDPSQLAWVDRGLRSLGAMLEPNRISSVAVPPLGCGLGGLAWPEVRNLILDHLGALNAQVLIYGSAPQSS